MENFIVHTWLNLVHRDLPKLVKQRCRTELRSRTLASIKLEISQTLSSLLDEIRTADGAKIVRTSILALVRPTPELHTGRPHDPLPTALVGAAHSANRKAAPRTAIS